MTQRQTRRATYDDRLRFDGKAELPMTADGPADVAEAIFIALRNHAGLVVRDVKLRQETITVYRRSDPTAPTVYRRGETAEVEPAVPGWTLPVDDVFAV